jgi:hypothetical protein
VAALGLTDFAATLAFDLADKNSPDGFAATNASAAAAVTNAPVVAMRTIEVKRFRLSQRVFIDFINGD